MLDGISWVSLSDRSWTWNMETMFGVERLSLVTRDYWLNPWNLMESSPPPHPLPLPTLSTHFPMYTRERKEGATVRQRMANNSPHILWLTINLSPSPSSTLSPPAGSPLSSESLSRLNSRGQYFHTNRTESWGSDESLIQVSHSER